MADRLDLGSSATWREGSNPSFPTGTWKISYKIFTNKDEILKIETTPQDNNQLSVSVELEQATIDKYNHKAMRAIAKKAKFPGFRPGKGSQCYRLANL